MRTAAIINVVEARLLTLAEAARYCGRSPAQFKRDCPVPPIAFGKEHRYDRRALDAWIDRLAGAIHDAGDDFTERLE
jgi:hypothetical protein